MMRGHSVSVDPGESRRAALKRAVGRAQGTPRRRADPGDSRRASLKLEEGDGLFGAGPSPDPGDSRRASAVYSIPHAELIPAKRDRAGLKRVGKRER